MNAAFLLIAGFSVASATALAADDKMSAEDFVKQAGEAGAAEVAMASWCIQRVTSKHSYSQEK